MFELLVAAVVVIALPLRAARRHQRSAPPAATGRYLVETALLTALLAILLWRRDVPLEAVGLRFDNPLRLLRNVAICAGVVMAMDVWSFWRALRRIRRSAAVRVPDGLMADALAGGRAALSFAAVVIAGSVWEELCFRATVFLLVPDTPVGLLIGVIGGSCLFGAQHLRNGRAGFTYSFCFGVLFALLYRATGDLVAVIVAHAAGNILVAVQWAPRIQRAKQQLARRTPVFLG